VASVAAWRLASSTVGLGNPLGSGRALSFAKEPTARTSNPSPTSRFCGAWLAQTPGPSVAPSSRADRNGSGRPLTQLQRSPTKVKGKSHEGRPQVAGFLGTIQGKQSSASVSPRPSRRVKDGVGGRRDGRAGTFGGTTCMSAGALAGTGAIDSLECEDTRRREATANVTCARRWV
jgi:hypothetical protein